MTCPEVVIEGGRLVGGGLQMYRPGSLLTLAEGHLYDRSAQDLSEFDSSGHDRDGRKSELGKYLVNMHEHVDDS